MTPEIRKLIDDNRLQPIETAPMSHQVYVLGLDHDVGLYNMHWREDKNCWCYSWNQEPCNPINWMQLPNNRLADALETGVEALEFYQRRPYERLEAYTHRIMHDSGDIADMAIQKIQATAGGKSWEAL